MDDYFLEPSRIRKRKTEEVGIFKPKTIKLTKRKTPIKDKVLGVGTYGCAVYPAKSCSPEHEQLDSHVAKVFYDKDSWEQEINENDLIKQLDPYSKFTLLSGMKNDDCKIKKMYDLTGCNDPAKWGADKDYYQIIYKMGGQDLEKIMNNPESTLFKHDNPELKFSYVKFLHSFKPIFQGFNNDSWKNASKAHTDIKALNITVNDEGKGNLIDFGLMMSCSDIYTNEARVNTDEVYMFWPPEFSSFWLLEKTIKSQYSKSLTGGLTISNLNSILNTISKNFVSNQFFKEDTEDIILKCPNQFSRNYLLGTRVLNSMKSLVNTGIIDRDIYNIINLKSNEHIMQVDSLWLSVLKQLSEQLNNIEQRRLETSMGLFRRTMSKLYTRLTSYGSMNINLDEVTKLLVAIYSKECNKIDIYMTGLAIFSGLILAFITGSLKIDNRFNIVMDYIGKLINFNMIERYNPEQALNGLNELIVELNKIEKVDTSVLKGGGFIRKIKFIHGVNGKKQNKNKNKNKKYIKKQTKRKNKYLNKHKKNKRTVKSK